MQELKPMNGRVILVEWKEEKTESPILIPDKKEVEKIFEVLDAGEENALEKGDKVLIDDYAGKERIIWGKVYYFVDFSDIIARLS